MATAIQPELWVDDGQAAVDFYVQAFGARVIHQVGEGDDIVAQLAIDGAEFWIATAGGSGRLVPRSVNGATARMLLVVEDPVAAHRAAVAAGATERSAVTEEHDWLVGRVTDRYGHEWEIGKPQTVWPPQ